MKLFKTIFLLILFSLGCNSSYDETNPKNCKQDSGSLSKIIDTIKNHRLGKYKTGDSVQSTISSIKKEYIVAFDSIQKNELDDKSEFEFFYTIKDKRGNKLFTLHPNNKNFVAMFEVVSNKYITDKGIKVGSSVSDIKAKYELSSVYFDYETGLLLLSGGFDGGFGLDYNSYAGVEKFNYEDPKIDSIPETTKINKIIIH